MGPGLAYANLADVPWEQLGPGDTVRIHFRSDPYREKILLSTSGTATQPIRVCGVAGPNGALPVLDGANARTRPSLNFRHWTGGTMESAGIIVIDKAEGDSYSYRPAHIVVEGLGVRGCRSELSFQAANGSTMSYQSFSAAIAVQTGLDIVLRNNELYDSIQGILSLSKDGSPGEVSGELTIDGNSLWGNGVVGSDRRHNVYTESLGIVFQYNRFGPLLAGALGSNLKDRSGGLVVRYNHFVNGARSMDLVDAEDFPATATADPRYHTTLVYGNLIRSDTSGRMIHYGGDSTVFPSYRKGTLYFYGNTILFNNSSSGYVSMFQLDTMDEHAEVFNNVFARDGGSAILRIGYQSGVTNLGPNWVTAGWVPGHVSSFTGTLTGQDKLIVGATPPTSSTEFRPPSGSPVIDRAEALPAAVASYPVEYQMDVAAQKVVPRTAHGGAADLGGFEAE